MGKPIHKFKVAKSWKDIKEVVENCKLTKYCSHDFETNGKPFYEEQAYPTIIGLSFQPCSSVVIPLNHIESNFKNDYLNVLDYIGEHLIINKDVTKIAWNVKFEHKWWLKYGWDFRGRVFDGMLAKYCLDETRPNGLGDIVLRIFPEFGDYKDDTEKLAKIHGWENIPMADLAPRNALDTDLTMRLMLRFEKNLIKHDLYSLFRNLIMTNSDLLAKVEYKGIGFDTEYNAQLIEDYKNKIEALDKALRIHKVLSKYEKYKKRRVIRQLIKTTQEEIDTLIEEGEPEDSRKIKNREEKVSKYIAGDFTTKKELKLIEPFNFGSPNQLIDLFFTNKKGFNFDVIKNTKGKDKKFTDRPSTDEEVLLTLQAKDKTKFIERLLELRGLNHLNSTYVVGMKNKVSSNNRIHGSFLIHGTVTGRLSSREPNLQNIPRDTTAEDIKKMFIPSSDKIIMEVDYSMAELRIVAELANETTMIEWFKQGKKVHEATACKMNNAMDRYEEVMKITKNEDHPEHIYWVKEKKKAKLINFGMLYGETSRKLSGQLNCSEEKAQVFMDQWFDTFPRIKKYIKKQQAIAIREGKVRSLWGRYRRLPDAQYTRQEALDNNMFGKWLEALRQSVNAPIQGAASDFTQFSSILIAREIEKGNLPFMEQIYTVHDSIGFEIDPKDAHYLAKRIPEICANPETLKYFGFKMKQVTMLVQAEFGKNWGLLRNYEKDFDYTQWVA